MTQIGLGCGEAVHRDDRNRRDTGLHTRRISLLVLLSSCGGQQLGDHLSATTPTCTKEKAPNESIERADRFREFKNVQLILDLMLGGRGWIRCLRFANCVE